MSYYEFCRKCQICQVSHSYGKLAQGLGTHTHKRKFVTTCLGEVEHLSKLALAIPVTVVRLVECVDGLAVNALGSIDEVA